MVLSPEKKEAYMRLALELAEEAAAAGEVPVGAVVAGPDGSILGRGRNRRQARGCALCHAELEAIAQACQAFGSWRLEGCALFVTLEPCPMCAGAVINARIPLLVYGAREPLSGSCGSVIDLFQERYGFQPAVYGGVLKEPCAALLQDFFAALRSGPTPPAAP